MCNINFELIKPKGIVEEKNYKLGVVEHNDTIIAGFMVVKNSAIKVLVKVLDMDKEVELEYVEVPVCSMRIQLHDKETLKLKDEQELIVGSCRARVDEAWKVIAKYEVSFYHIKDVIEDMILSEDKLTVMTENLIMENTRKKLRYTKGIATSSTFDRRNIEILDVQRARAF